MFKNNLMIQIIFQLTPQLSRARRRFLQIRTFISKRRECESKTNPKLSEFQAAKKEYDRVRWQFNVDKRILPRICESSAET